MVSSHIVPLAALCRPNRKRPTLLPQQEEGKYTLRPATAQPMTKCHNSAHEKPLHFQQPPHSLLSCEHSSLSLSPDLQMAFAMACLS